jgi:hypothetical protein
MALTIILSPITILNIPAYETGPVSSDIEFLGSSNVGQTTIIFLINSGPIEYKVSRLIVNGVEYILSEPLTLRPQDVTAITLPNIFSKITLLAVECSSGECFRVVQFG